MKRARSVMLRFSDDEYDSLVRAKPPGDELASFARKVLVDAVSGREPESLRREFAFVVACLSPEISFDEALLLFDEHVSPSREEAANGRGHQG